MNRRLFIIKSAVTSVIAALGVTNLQASNAHEPSNNDPWPDWADKRLMEVYFEKISISGKPRFLVARRWDTKNGNRYFTINTEDSVDWRPREIGGFFKK